MDKPPWPLTVNHLIGDCRFPCASCGALVMFARVSLTQTTGRLDETGGTEPAQGFPPIGCCVEHVAIRTGMSKKSSRRFMGVLSSYSSVCQGPFVSTQLRQLRIARRLRCAVAGGDGAFEPSRGAVAVVPQQGDDRGVVKNIRIGRVEFERSLDLFRRLGGASQL